MQDMSPVWTEEEEHGLHGVVLDIIYSNPDNGYTVFTLEPDGQGRSVTCCGVMGPMHSGELLQLKGSWSRHPRYGMQFRVESWALGNPHSVEGLKRFLGSGLITGIGPSLATRIVERFGESTISVLEDHPTKLAEVKGLGVKKREALLRFWGERSEAREFLLFLSDHGIGIATAMRIQKAYGREAMVRLRQHPYDMVRDIQGFGFLTVDRLALRLGVPADHPDRLHAALRYQVQQAKEGGHCNISREQLLEKAAELLHLEVERLEKALSRCLEDGSLLWVGEVIVLPEIYSMEEEVTGLLDQRLKARPVCPYDERRLDALILREEVQLSKSQIKALDVVLREPFSIVTGGPGVGKTTLVRLMVNYWVEMGFEPTLAAPTGRAAQRMEEACGRSASTLHRLLKVNPSQGFVHHRENPLDLRIVICDEVSMVDLELFHAFLSALPAWCQVVLVGDRDQLPSVGAGRILGDCLDSGLVPSVTLTEVFRQGEGSLLVENSHRLLKGQTLLQPKPGEVLKDYYFIDCSSPEDLTDKLRRVVTERLPAKFGEKSLEHTQVLSPMKKGALGTVELNLKLQEWVNPSGEVVHLSDPPLRVGDRVVQLSNNYDLELYNGDLGWVVGRVSGESVVLDFSGRQIVFEGEGFRDLSLSYAMTVHKSQGCEYPFVVMPLWSSHRHMLTLELLYTAMTRAKRMFIWLGDAFLLQDLIENPPRVARHTLLQEMLRSLVGKGKDEPF